MTANIAQPTTPRRSKDVERIGSFHRQEEIGRGSFATVYKALHTSSQGVQTVVAIKSVNLGKLNKKLKDNLTSEISILKGLHHPHIVALIDCKESSSHIHLVMEYVALGDLSYFIKRRDQIKHSELVGNMMTKYPNPRAGGLHEVVVRHFLQQLSSALQFLRARNLIHRDVKPQNLLLNPSPDYFVKHRPSPMPYCASEDSLVPICGIRSLPMLKIADFGFARSLPSTSLAETLCGSPLYMAPEILRYEKYDAKADLWSVGTVLYEMVTSKPPFRASNHVELLRRIEKGEDKIKFPEDILVSDPLKKLIRALLKRDPRDRLSFPDFFSNETITGPIPGLVDEDLPEPVVAQVQEAMQEQSRRRSSRTDPTGIIRPSPIKDLESPYTDPSRAVSADDVRDQSTNVQRRRSSAVVPTLERPVQTSNLQNEAVSNSRPSSPATQRPSLLPHATAPGRQELIFKSPQPASAAMARQKSGGHGRVLSSAKDHLAGDDKPRAGRSNEERERQKIQDEIADMRDYVMVEKKAVEVNAFADELESSPRLQLNQTQATQQAGAMVRRATTQAVSLPTTGAQTSATRAVQIASGRRPDTLHHRQNSYERRYGPSPSSATSAISKALNMASGRLFGVGFSPPVNLVRGGRSPPIGYSPFPQYPGTQSSLVVVGDATKPVAADEDSRTHQVIEEIAMRSDVIYGFAEVKYKQLIPAVPSPSHPGLGLRQVSVEQIPEDPALNDLTVEAIVTVSEEALMLYVKALSLLAKSMDVAAKWWTRRNRSEAGSDTTLPRAPTSASGSNQRMNSVVQWVRSRFNEVLEKADLVRLKLIENQKLLPEDHPSHPSNLSMAVGSAGVMGTSADQVIVSSGITAEKLMYDRALEMSRFAAMSELTGEDLPGCEVSYITAIRMLEAILESEEESSSRTGSGVSEPSRKEGADDEGPINGLEAEDRKDVRNLVNSIRKRLAALQKKLRIIQKRASAPVIGSPSSPTIPHKTSNTTISATAVT